MNLQNMAFIPMALIGVLVLSHQVARVISGRHYSLGAVQAAICLVMPMVTGPLLGVVDTMISVMAGVQNRHTLGNAWSMIAYGSSGSSSTHPVSKPAPASKPAVHKTAPSAPDHTWDHLWPWLVGALILAIIVVVGVVGVAMARAKGADIAAEAKRKREARERELERQRTNQEVWDRLGTTLDDLNQRWNVYDHDLTLLLRMPAIRDVSVPSTAAAIEALFEADALRTVHPDPECANANDTTYARAVRTAEQRVEAAIVYARRDALRSMPADERRKLTQAQALLATAQDAAATPSERHLAYQRVRAIMDDLSISVPEPIMDAIEHESRLLIEATS